MGMPQEKRARRFVRWLKDKIENKRNQSGKHDPWWVTLLLDVGRPIVAVLILTMCAPGEHYLAVQAGWSDRLAWGMPGTLTAYAGIAAVVATKRPKGAPGRKTAIWGAVVSVGLAMAAQPVAHLYGRDGLTTQLIVLTTVMGVVPAAVFGHLLHMGASSPGQQSSGTAVLSLAPPTVTPPRTVPQAPAVVGTMSSRTTSPRTPSLTSVPEVSLVKSIVPARVAVDELSRLRSLTEIVRALRAAGHDRDEIKEIVPTVPGYEDAKDNSLNKALARTA